MWDGRWGLINTAKHRLELLKLVPRPVHSAPYREGPKNHKFEKTEIDKMLDESITEPAQTDWASPIVFASKRNGTLRFGVEYR